VNDHVGDVSRVLGIRDLTREVGIFPVAIAAASIFTRNSVPTVCVDQRSDFADLILLIWWTSACVLGMRAVVMRLAVLTLVRSQSCPPTSDAVLAAHLRPLILTAPRAHHVHWHFG
jgi:hypothetical protein